LNQINCSKLFDCRVFPSHSVFHSVRKALKPLGKARARGYGAAMTNANDSKQPSPPSPDKTPVSGGIFIAFGLLGGTVVGFMNNQISAGMIGGFGVGILVAVAIYLFDRRR
jgi:hypothetical protein